METFRKNGKSHGTFTRSKYARLIRINCGFLQILNFTLSLKILYIFSLEIVIIICDSRAIKALCSRLHILKFACESLTGFRTVTIATQINIVRLFIAKKSRLIRKCDNIINGHALFRYTDRLIIMQLFRRRNFVLQYLHRRARAR